MATMRVLVTGGAGFIGSNLVHHLVHASGQASPACCPDQEAYEDVHAPADLEIITVDKMTYAADPRNLKGLEGTEHTLERVDVCNVDEMDAVFTAFEPEIVFHLAAESHVDRSIQDGVPFAETNVVGTQVLLDLARMHEIDRFVHVSTDEVYGSIREGSFNEEDPYDPSSPYAASKAGSDLLALAHQTTYGTPITITRCTNNYGPRQHPEKLIPLMATNALTNDPLPVYGDGTNVRDWLYVKDHCQALWALAEKANFDGDVYNIAAQDERRNLNVVQGILEKLEKPQSLIHFVEDRPGHDYRYSLDDAKMRSLGWAPRIPFEEGLDHAIRWITHEGVQPLGKEVENA